MAENITLTNLANLQNGTTVVNSINGNNATITSAFTDVLSRTGIQPNSMGAPLDMNNWPIMNLPAPGSANSPARLVDVTGSNPINISLSLTGDTTAPASSGVLTTTTGKVNGVVYPSGPSTNTVPVVTGTNTVAYQQVNTAQIANNAVTAALIANNTITNTQLANNTVGNAQIRQGVARSVIGVTGNTTANVADIQGTTRQVLAVNTAGTGVVFAQPQGDQLLGTVTNDSATAGNVGEFITSSIVQGSALALTTATPLTITSVSLTAGDWDIYGSVYIIPAATTTVTTLAGSVGTTTNTNNFTAGQYFQIIMASATPGTNPVGFAIPVFRVSLTGTTTYFLVCQSNFGTSTNAGFGSLSARRAR